MSAGASARRSPNVAPHAINNTEPTEEGEGGRKEEERREGVCGMLSQPLLAGCGQGLHKCPKNPICSSKIISLREGMRRGDGQACVAGIGAVVG